MAGVHLKSINGYKILMWASAMLATIAIAFGVLPDAWRQMRDRWDKAEAELEHPGIGMVRVTLENARGIERSASETLRKLDENLGLLDRSRQKLQDSQSAATKPNTPTDARSLLKNLTRDRARGTSQREAFLQLQKAAQQAIREAKDGSCWIDRKVIARALSEVGMSPATRPKGSTGPGAIAIEMALQWFKYDPDEPTRPNDQIIGTISRNKGDLPGE